MPAPEYARRTRLGIHSSPHNHKKNEHGPPSVAGIICHVKGADISGVGILTCTKHNNNIFSVYSYVYVNPGNKTNDVVLFGGIVAEITTSTSPRAYSSSAKKIFPNKNEHGSTKKHRGETGARFGARWLIISLASKTSGS